MRTFNYLFYFYLILFYSSLPKTFNLLKKIIFVLFTLIEIFILGNKCLPLNPLIFEKITGKHLIIYFIFILFLNPSLKVFKALVSKLNF